MYDNVPADLRYDNNGTRWFPTEEYKHAILLDFAKMHNLRTFVETGTHRCWTLSAVYKQFDHSYSIELGDTYYQDAVKLFKGIDSVTLIHGDSAVELKNLINRLPKTPTLFYLDAHYSGGDTVGRNRLPLRAELDTIFNSGIPAFVVIDDCVPYWNLYITEIMMQAVAEYPKWECEVKHGLGRIWNKNAAY